MPVFFFDASTVLKQYVQEPATAWLQALAAPTARHSLVIGAHHPGRDSRRQLAAFSLVVAPIRLRNELRRC
jgi:hypothetical protein